MQNKPKIIAQAILLFAMAALFAVVPILSLQQEEITDLTTITATEIDNYIKKPVEMDSGDYKILSGSSMWERHQAAGEEPSGDYVTAFYPLEVYAKNGDVYVIAAEFDADKKDMYYINNAPIKGNILPIPTEHLEDYLSVLFEHKQQNPGGRSHWRSNKRHLSCPVCRERHCHAGIHKEKGRR